MSLLRKLPTDPVILSALRTPITRSYRGPLSTTPPEALLHSILRPLITSAPPSLTPTDISVGTVLSELGGSKASRSSLLAIPGIQASKTSLYTVNRACASSLQSIWSISQSIRLGDIPVGIAAGMENMSLNYGTRAIPTSAWSYLRTTAAAQAAQDCFMPMGLTSENVAERYGISREAQDAFAVESHRRAAEAQKAGRFDAEIVPVTTRWTPPKPKGKHVSKEEEPEEREVTVTADDGIRLGTTLESLAKLKPCFKADGTGTAGNSSQVSDGAAGLLMARRDYVEALGLQDQILGKFVGAVTVGCAPDEMGVGPAVAIPQLLEKLQITKEDVDRWELNEAFASQAVYCLRELGLEKAWEDGKVNPDGGAIALGHPLGATGARLAVSVVNGIQEGQVGVVSMCVGTGMGMAGAFVRE